MSNANIRKAASTVAGLALATVFFHVAHAELKSQVDIFVLPDGFRVQSVYLPTIEPVRDLLLNTKPEIVVLHVCALTPQVVGQKAFEELRFLLPSTPEVKLAGRNAIECAFPTERERGGRKA